MREMPAGWMLAARKTMRYDLTVTASPSWPQDEKNPAHY